MSEKGYVPVKDEPEQENEKPQTNTLNVSTQGISSISSSVFTLTNNIIGATLFTMPWVLRESSIVTGFMILVFVGILNGFSFMLLAKCSDLANTFSYKEMGTLAFGKKAGTLIQTVMGCYTLGSCISYVVLTGDFVPSTMENFKPGLWGISHDTFRLIVIIVASVVIFLPLSFIQNLRALRYTAVLAICGIIYGVILIVVRLGTASSYPSVQAFDFPPCLGAAIPIMNVAFTAHYNAPRYYQELQDRSLQRFLRVIISANVISFVVYFLSALFGYLNFGSDTKGNILNNYSTDDKMALLGRMMLAAVVVCTYPLAFHSLKSSAMVIFYGEQKISNQKYVITNLTLVLITVVIGASLEKIEVVLSYKGAIFGSCMVYIFPGLMYLKLRKNAVETNCKTTNLESINNESNESNNGVKSKSLTVLSVYDNTVRSPLITSTFLHDSNYLSSSYQKTERFLAMLMIVWGAVVGLLGIIINIVIQSGGLKQCSK